MEDNYRQSRGEIDAAIDAELDPIYRDLNNLWWDYSALSQRLSEAIVHVNDAQQVLSRLVVETREDPLPFDTVQTDQDTSEHV